jgi:hypothetical protein
MQSIRLWLVSSRSSTDEVLAALVAASAKLLTQNGILHTRPGDRPERDDPNQYVWVLPVEIYDDEDESMVPFLQLLEHLSEQGIVEVVTRRGLLRFRPTKRED